MYQGPDSDYQGREICFASNEDTLTIVDMTDKSTPVLISKGSYPEFGYTHQGWLTPDQRYFIMDDEIDEMANRHNTRTYVFDLNDLDNPVFTGFHESNGPAIDHNQYVVGQHTFQANYSRGLRILKLNDLSTASMEEVAWFDTFPEADSIDSFSGAWNVYPFFDNGLILISDINRGIFILRANLGDEPVFQINQGLSGAWYNPQTPGQGMLVDIQPDNNFIFVSWFVHEATQSSSSTKVGDDNHRWLTMQGNYQDGTATLPVFNSSGGRFNDPAEVDTEQVGTATLRFEDCSSASVEYNLEDGNLTGTIDLQRLLPSAAALCESLTAGQAGDSVREQLDSAP